MANLNKVILIGRIVADPEQKDITTFSNGGKVTRLRFVVNNRKFNQEKQEWTDDPVWLYLKFYNRGEFGKLADRAATLRKGQQICLEGHLVQEEWPDREKEGQKKPILLIYVDSFQTLDRRDDNGGGFGGEGASMGGNRPRNTSRTPAGTTGGRNNFNGGGEDDGGSFNGGSESGDDIPF
jgi:single stranded DNA-binding protein